MHTDYEREPVPLFYQGARRGELLESELEQDAVEYNEIVAIQLISQPLEERSLFGCKNITIKIVAIRNPDPASIASADSFKRI